MKKWLNETLSALQAGLPIWERAINTVEPLTTNVAVAGRKLFSGVKKEAVKLTKVDRDGVTAWAKELKKAGLQSEDISFLIVHLEQARGAREDAFVTGLIKTLSDLAPAALTLLGLEGVKADDSVVFNLGDLMSTLDEAVQNLPKDEETPEEQEDE